MGRMIEPARVNAALHYANTQTIPGQCQARSDIHTHNAHTHTHTTKTGALVGHAWSSLSRSRSHKFDPTRIHDLQRFTFNVVRWQIAVHVTLKPVKQRVHTDSTKSGGQEHPPPSLNRAAAEPYSPSEDTHRARWKHMPKRAQRTYVHMPLTSTSPPKVAISLIKPRHEATKATPGADQALHRAKTHARDPGCQRPGCDPQHFRVVAKKTIMPRRVRVTICVRAQ
ncbi:hypothetical protein VOLCADRAFT_91970 [Volvox carteri f. nagariensis]|uniref:Uncharacterized protein n=1 Tax=Volvox carteri f. nagariensis TaxID=3068 RepID=D8TYF2_VOLCA|nr:uncharacterized protein VOLCADRAFT_91970 [Volvox carteri f. nagariensis]EFJ47545.1 hypothetical protein VOLCADRAFT_91970 [Volvox carteri f. nagariensis]|eukprot:XP_002951369.1 hypothetical protein VOLCADRAFT_91970 [Volvox carteri f. nagariensis]